jgi:hypothetical protein
MERMPDVRVPLMAYRAGEGYQRWALSFWSMRGVLQIYLRKSGSTFIWAWSTTEML